jgi:hypothetical protein
LAVTVIFQIPDVPILKPDVLVFTGEFSVASFSLGANIKASPSLHWRVLVPLMKLIHF